MYAALWGFNGFLGLYWVFYRALTGLRCGLQSLESQIFRCWRPWISGAARCFKGSRGIRCPTNEEPTLWRAPVFKQLVTRRTLAYQTSRYLLYRVSGALVLYIVRTWGGRVRCSTGVSQAPATHVCDLLTSGYRHGSSFPLQWGCST